MKHSWNSNTPQIHSSTAHALAHLKKLRVNNPPTLPQSRGNNWHADGSWADYEWPSKSMRLYRKSPQVATVEGVFPTAQPQQQDIEIYWEAVAKSSRWFDDIWWFVFLLKDWKLQQIGDIGADGASATRRCQICQAQSCGASGWKLTAPRHRLALSIEDSDNRGLKCW